MSDRLCISIDQLPVISVEFAFMVNGSRYITSLHLLFSHSVASVYFHLVMGCLSFTASIAAALVVIDENISQSIESTNRNQS